MDLLRQSSQFFARLERNHFRFDSDSEISIGKQLKMAQDASAPII
jgi:hypothetical protein